MPRKPASMLTPTERAEMWGWFDARHLEGTDDWLQQVIEDRRGKHCLAQFASVAVVTPAMLDELEDHLGALVVFEQKQMGVTPPHHLRFGMIDVVAPHVLGVP